MIRDRQGRIVFSEQLLEERGSQGDDIYLTIDKTIQHLAERELALAVHTFEAKAASLVALALVVETRRARLLHQYR